MNKQEVPLWQKEININNYNLRCHSGIEGLDAGPKTSRAVIDDRWKWLASWFADRIRSMKPSSAFDHKSM